MIDSGEDKAKVVQLDVQAGEDSALPFCIELWDAAKADTVERMLARAASLGLARAIFKAAGDEHPGRRITLRQGRRFLADSAGGGAA
jgi:hypothetical protein